MPPPPSFNSDRIKTRFQRQRFENNRLLLVMNRVICEARRDLDQCSATNLLEHTDVPRCDAWCGGEEFYQKI